MANILIEILRFPSDRQLPALDYYVLLDFLPLIAGTNIIADTATVSTSRRPLSSMDNRTVLSQPTPTLAIKDAQQKLQASFQPQDKIEFKGTQYASVAAAVNAITQAQWQWQ
jgi:hypothetical protein